MFPIYHKDEEFVEPENDQVYYVVAANGLFQVKKTLFFTSSSAIFQPAADASLGWLQEHDSGLSFHLPKKIPADKIGQIVSFFKEVQSKLNNSEAIVLVYWNTVKNEYHLVVPEQKVAQNALPGYEVGPNPANCVRFGTIHSHGSMQPFHSDVDNKDEITDDGIHITIGHLNTYPAFACSIVCDGHRYTAKIEDIVDLPVFPHPVTWIDRLQHLFGNRQIPGMPSVTPTIPSQVTQVHFQRHGGKKHKKH